MCPMRVDRVSQSWTLLVLYQSRRAPWEHQAWFAAGGTAFDIRGGLVVCSVISLCARAVEHATVQLCQQWPQLDHAEAHGCQQCATPSLTAVARRLMPSHAQVVVFDGRVTPHGAWVSPSADSGAWPFHGVALVVQSAVQ